MSSKCPKICSVIGKREAKNIELSKREFDLRRRLEMLECWLPAVTMMRMMTGDLKSNDMNDLIDKKTASMTVSCLCPNARLSQHEDVRIREIDSERKKAEKRLNEARLLLNEKQTAVIEQSKRIEEAREKRDGLEIKIKEIEAKLSSYNNLNQARSEQSIGSIGPEELVYLTKLEELVKSEAQSKKQLEELEKRQEIYMKALESAGEIWRKEEQSIELDGLKNQLEVKSSANQQLANKICQLEDQVELLKGRLTACNDKLKQFIDIEKSDMRIGTDQTYSDVESSIKPDSREVSIIHDYSTFQRDEEVDGTVSVETKETTATVEVTERSVQETVISSLELKDEETATEHELQFVSLDESTWSSEAPTTLPSIYEGYEQELISKITKFDVSTTMSINFALIDIPELEIWRNHVNNIRKVISECDTCKVTKPQVLMIQEAISRQLGIEFIVSDDENYQVITDKDGLIETRGEYQVSPAMEQVSEMIVHDDDKGSNDGIVTGSGIYGGDNTSNMMPKDSKLSQAASIPMAEKLSAPTDSAVIEVTEIESSQQIYGMEIDPLNSNEVASELEKVGENKKYEEDDESWEIDNKKIDAVHEKVSKNNDVDGVNEMRVDEIEEQKIGDKQNEIRGDDETVEIDETSVGEIDVQEIGVSDVGNSGRVDEEADEGKIVRQSVIEVGGIRDENFSEVGDMSRENERDVEGEVIEVKGDEIGENGDRGITKRESKVGSGGQGSGEIRGLASGERRDMSGCGNDDSQGKCPVTSKMSFCICHALRRWPRMTRREYRESTEAITKIPHTKPRSPLYGSKTVSSATVESVLTQTNVEMQNVISDGGRISIPEETAEGVADMCDPCECDPCASVSTTSSEIEPYELKKANVETKEQGVMAKIYRSRR